jgi:hypothetical protein
MSMKTPLRNLDRALAAMAPAAREEAWRFIEKLIALARATDEEAFPDALGRALVDCLVSGAFAWKLRGEDVLQRQLAEALTPANAPTVVQLIEQMRERARRALAAVPSGG